MSDRKDTKGFAGLSSLTSDVDEIVGDSIQRGRQIDWAGNRERRKDEQRPELSESVGSKSLPSRQSETHPEVIPSTTSNTRTIRPSKPILITGLIVLGLLIWLYDCSSIG